MIKTASFVKHLPKLKHEIKRLAYLEQKSATPRIAVFGKYNHGKSTLLNAIIGLPIFKTADKRETIEVAEYRHNDVTWVDTPGLDADIHQQDDQKAIKNVFERADFIFLVHQVTAGELDKYETQMFKQLAHVAPNFSNKACLLLTQIDQVSPAELAQVEKQIAAQLKQLAQLKNMAGFSNLPMLTVSALRHQKGIASNKPALCDASGFNRLFCLIAKIKQQTVQLTKQEQAQLKQKIQLAITQAKQQSSNKLQELQAQRQQLKQQFTEKTHQFLAQVRANA